LTLAKSDDGGSDDNDDDISLNKETEALVLDEIAFAARSRSHQKLKLYQNSLYSTN
jgi:hypothetical protein